jgi:hypothetical protein
MKNVIDVAAITTIVVIMTTTLFGVVATEAQAACQHGQVCKISAEAYANRMDKAKPVLLAKGEACREKSRLHDRYSRELLALISRGNVTPEEQARCGNLRARLNIIYRHRSCR